jgi:hypothetical protein
MAVIVKAVLGGKDQPYLLYALGGMIAIMLEMLKVPPLAFALGMYLPFQINMAVFAGGFAAWVVGRTGGSEAARKARAEQGTLIASGLLAGAAIIGTIGATLRLDVIGNVAQYMDVRHWSPSFGENFYEAVGGQALSLAMFVLLGVACWAIARWGAGRESSG